MRNRTILTIWLLVASSCGGSSPSSSGPPTTPTAPPAPAPATWSIGGRVIDAIDGQGVAGAKLTFASFPEVTANPEGRWSVEGTGASPGAAVVVATISAPGFHPRETRIEWRTGGRSDVELSLMPDRAPFSLDFFRAFVRNGLEGGSEALEPIRRWTSNPNFYLNAINPRNQQRIVASEIAVIEQAVRDAVPQLTGGRLTVGEFVVGDTPGTQRRGYIDIELVYEPDGDYCGKAFVGSNPGRITLNYERCIVSWCRDPISANIVAHEVGHAMGFWHTPDGTMYRVMNNCRSTTFTEMERVHAAIAYQRPAGNRDIDQDPIDFRALDAEPPREIVCTHTPSR
jgi:hypothetical protein